MTRFNSVSISKTVIKQLESLLSMPARLRMASSSDPLPDYESPRSLRCFLFSISSVTSIEFVAFLPFDISALSDHSRIDCGKPENISAGCLPP